MKPILKIKTKLTKKDYKNFYYIVAFKKKPLRIVLMLVFTIIISLLSNMEDLTNISSILLNWLVFSGVLILSLVIKIHFKVASMYNTDNFYMFDSFAEIDFYDDFLKVSSDDKKSSSEIDYSKLFEILESKKYFLIYLNAGRASIIRKEDLDKDSIEKLTILLKEKTLDKYRVI